MNPNPPFRYFAVLLALAVSACEDNEARTSVQRLEAELATLRNTVALDNSKPSIAKLETDVQGLQNGLMSLIHDANAEKRTILDPTVKGYGFVDTTAGRLVIACEGAEQYLDGHKMMLRIGNPFTMTFTGFTVSARFGKRPPEFPKESPPDASQTRVEQIAAWRSSYNAWETSLKQKQTSFTEALQPGAWTQVSLILSPSKPEEVSYIDFQIRTDEIGLRKPTQ